MIADFIGTVVLLPAKAEATDAVRVFVHARHVIEDVAELGAGAHLPAPQAEAFDRLLIAQRPGHFVEAMDVLLGVEVARKPGEIEPVAQLPFHVAPGRLANFMPQSVGVVSGLNGNNVANGTVVNALKRLPFTFVITVAETGDDAEPLPLGLGAGRHHAAHPGSVDGDRLFSEYMLACPHRGLDVHGPKMRRRTQQYGVHPTINHLLIGVEADELLVAWHRDLFGEPSLALQLPQARLEPIAERVTHGHQADVGIRLEGIGGCPGAAPPAANQADAQRVRAGRVDKRHLCQCRRCRDCGDI